MWEEITHPIINFNGGTVEVYEWISKGATDERKL